MQLISRPRNTAENGATAPQLMAMFGWESVKQAMHYAQAADQKRLAGDAMHLMIGKPIVPLLTDGSQVGLFDQEKSTT